MESYKEKCKKCEGTGKILYGDTGTYWSAAGLSFMAGAAMTEDTCNVCWGTGDSWNQGENLILKPISEGRKAKSAALELYTALQDILIHSSMGWEMQEKLETGKKAVDKHEWLVPTQHPTEIK